MTKLLFVDHTPFAGGAQLVLAEHIAALDKGQFSAVVACTDTVPSLVEKYREAGAEVVVVPMPRLRGWPWRAPWQLAKTIWQLRQLIRRQSIDLVVANTTRASYYLALAAGGTKTPVIWWVRDYLYPRWLFRLMVFVPRKIIFVSRSVAEFYLPVGHPKATVLYVASDLYKQLAAVSSAQINQERHKYNIGPQDIVIGFMGRLVAEKGAQDVVAAVASLLAGYPQLKLLIVGSGRGQMHDIEAELRQSVTDQHLDRSIYFAGYQTDQALYYSLFSLFVLATRDREPFATSVVQAMMAGTVVIGTAAGGTPELVRDGQTGLLYPPAKVEALANAIRRLIDEPELAARLAQAGQQYVLQYPTEERLARQAEQLYMEVLSGSS
jgi:glycosyltransferase involved in cell wall biosynthesis